MILKYSPHSVQQDYICHVSEVLDGEKYTYINDIHGLPNKTDDRIYQRVGNDAQNVEKPSYVTPKFFPFNPIQNMNGTNRDAWMVRIVE